MHWPSWAECLRDARRPVISPTFPGMYLNPGKAPPPCPAPRSRVSQSETHCMAVLKRCPVACRLKRGSATGCDESARLYFRALSKSSWFFVHCSSFRINPVTVRKQEPGTKNFPKLPVLLFHLQQFLGDLHGVGSRAFADVVTADEKDQAVFHAFIKADTADKDIVLTGNLDRHRV